MGNFVLSKKSYTIGNCNKLSEYRYCAKSKINKLSFLDSERDVIDLK